MTKVGAFWGNRSAPFSFFPKGALTHHRAAGPAVVAFPLVRPCALRGGCGSCGNLQTMLSCLRAAVAIVCAEWISAPIHSACENLHPAALSQRQAITKGWPAFSFAKEKQKKEYGGDSDWQYTTWKRKSSAEVRADLLAQHRPI